MTELEYERIKTESARMRWADCQNRLAQYERIGIEVTGAECSIPDAFHHCLDRIRTLEAQRDELLRISRSGTRRDPQGTGG